MKGRLERNKKGEKRLTPLRCNQRHICADDNYRYYKGRAMILAEKLLAVAEANNVARFYRFQLTIPEHIRDQIQTDKQLRSFVKEGNKLLQEFYGCPMKGDQVYLNGNIGVAFFTHWYSTHEPWKKSPHLHGVVCPVKIQDGNAVNVERYISINDLRRLRQRWGEFVERVANNLGFEGIEAIPNEVNLHVSYDKLFSDQEEKKGFFSHMFYDGRSPVQDLEKAIIGQDLSQKMIMMTFEKDRYGYYAVWNLEDYVNQLMERLAIKGDYKIFGWLTRFKTVSKILGIELEGVKDDFEPIPELTERVDFKRAYEKIYNKEKRRFEEVKHIFIKRQQDPDKPEYWKEINLRDVFGENVFFGSRKRYIYRLRE